MNITKIMEILMPIYAAIYLHTWTIFMREDIDKSTGDDDTRVRIPKDSFYTKKASEKFQIYGIATPTWLGIIFTSGVFSNWFPCIISWCGFLFLSVEHCFIYRKITEYPAPDLTDEEIAFNRIILDKVMHEKCPMKLQNLGRQAKIDITEWNKNSARVLKECIILKFTQNSYLKVILDVVREFDLKIFEGTSDDNYGIGIKFDPANSEHFNPDMWPGKKGLTEIYKNVVNEIYTVWSGEQNIPIFQMDMVSRVLDS